MTIDHDGLAGGATLARLRQILAAEEGRRTRVYPDTLGRLTVGIGHLVRPEDELKSGDVISEARVDALFEKDGARALAAAAAQAAKAGITSADFVVRLAAVNFQLGTGWTAVFPKTWALVMAGDYRAAAGELEDSLWARQTPRRVAAFQAALRQLSRKTNGN